jgi:hypothetical protein
MSYNINIKFNTNFTHGLEHIVKYCIHIFHFLHYLHEVHKMNA